MSARVGQFGPEHGTARRIAEQQQPARGDEPDMVQRDLGQPCLHPAGVRPAIGRRAQTEATWTVSRDRPMAASIRSNSRPGAPDRI